MYRLMLSLAVVGSITSPAYSQPAGEATVAWINEHAIPLKTSEAENGFEDLQALKPVIGDARVVSLGESTHGSREIFQMKHRLLEYLAAELGFTIFSIEANMPESYRIDHYVHTGEGDPKQLIKGMYFWTWNTEEVHDMVQWMRRFNQAGKRIDFTGFDMQTPDVATEEVLQFLKKVDETQHAAARTAYAGAVDRRQVAMREFGVATGSFPVDAARGKKIVFAGWIKTEKLEGYAGLWWRADGPDQKTLAFDNMQSKQINGTRDWEHFAIELDVPAETININFGLLMPGTGRAWFDGLTVTLDGQPYDKPDVFDFDFESDQVKGLGVPPFRTYRAELDAKTVKVGKQSLRLESVARPRDAISPEEFHKTLAACESVHASLKQSRDEFLQKVPAKEVDWAIQNARVVVTALQQRAGNMHVRDAAMADNVEWILQQNPDARIVLWAHNGHVNKSPFAMGKYLDRKYGEKHLAIGFATCRGEYQAIGNRGLSNHTLQAPADDSYEAAFQRTGVPRFFLDLRGTSSVPDAAWLTEPHPFRSIGALAMEQQFNPQALPTLFDGIVFLEETTAARPLK
jgi:erythromycin esterase-like protein